MSELPLIEGAACAELPPQVVDKYFYSNSHPMNFQAQVARAICAHCVVRLECLEQALIFPPERGTQAGKSRKEILTMRQRLLGENATIDMRYLTHEELSVDPPTAEWKHPNPTGASKPGLRFPPRDRALQTTTDVS